MRCDYLNFTKYRFNNCQETSREKQKHAFVCNITIHKGLFNRFGVFATLKVS